MVDFLHSSIKLANSTKQQVVMAGFLVSRSDYPPPPLCWAYDNFFRPLRGCRHQGEAMELVDFLASVVYVAWLGERRRVLKAQLRRVFAGLPTYDSAAEDAPAGESSILETLNSAGEH